MLFVALTAGSSSRINHERAFHAISTCVGSRHLPCQCGLIPSQYGIRFEDNEQVEVFMYQLAEEMSRRLSDIDMRGRSLTLKVLKRDPTAPVEAPKVNTGVFQIFYD